MKMWILILTLLATTVEAQSGGSLFNPCSAAIDTVHFRPDGTSDLDPRQLEFCISSTQCMQTQTCIGGVCGCTDTQYYQGTTCINKSSYRSRCCSSTQCKDTLTCINLVCGCTDTQFFDSTCKPKSNHGGECSNSIPCKDTLTCVNGVCGCTDTQYFDSTCKAKTNYGGQCSSSTQCKDTLTCINGVCGCTDTQYFDSTCKPKFNYGGLCSSSTQCKDTLTCINGVCGCTDTQYFDSTCKPKTNYGGQCSSSTQCKDTLTCINGVCGCTDTQFFDSTCKAKFNYRDQCSSSTQCKDTLTCLNGVCGCTDTQYFDSACKPKRDHTEECDPTISNVCSIPENVCIPDITGKHRCLCDVSDYSRSGVCHPLTELRVSQLSVERNSPTQVRFTWTADSYSQQVQYKIRWTTDVNIDDKGEKAASKDGVTLSDLAPGRLYRFTAMSTISGDEFYPDKNTMVEKIVEMLPAPPGPINKETSQLEEPPYVLRFRPSEGDVEKYKMTLTPQGNSTTISIETKASNIETSELVQNEEYTYAIIAFNNIGDFTEPTLGSFRTDPDSEGNTEDGTRRDEEEVNVPLVAGVVGAVGAVVIIVVVVAVVMCRKRRASRENSDNVEKTPPAVEKMEYNSPNGHVWSYDNTDSAGNIYNEAHEDGYNSYDAPTSHDGEDHLATAEIPHAPDNKHYRNMGMQEESGYENSSSVLKNGNYANATAYVNDQ